jgi:hypothetical protein
VVDAGTDAGLSLTDAAAPALPTDAGDAAVSPPVGVVDAGGDAAADASF